MKIITLITVLFFSMNSFAIFGLFEKKIDPRNLTSYEDRMRWIQQDPAYMKMVEEEKRKAEAAQERMNEEWKRIESDLAANTNYTPEQQAQMKAEREKRQKAEFEAKLATIKEEVLREFAIAPDGTVVNIKEHQAAQEKERQEKEALRRLRQFQSEEGLPLSKDINDVRFNTK